MEAGDKVIITNEDSSFFGLEGTVTDECETVVGETWVEFYIDGFHYQLPFWENEFKQAA